jgi:GxxExxY protein
MAKLLYKDLSYQIQGCFMEVRKNFGPGHKEIVYQNALAEELENRKFHLKKKRI